MSEIASISSSKAIPDFFPSSFIKAQEAQKQRQEDVEALTEFLKSKFSNDDTDSQSQEKNFSDINLEYSRLMLQGISADQIVNSSWHHSLLQETAVEQENLYTQLFDFTDLDCF